MIEIDDFYVFRFFPLLPNFNLFMNLPDNSRQRALRLDHVFEYLRQNFFRHAIRPRALWSAVLAVRSTNPSSVSLFGFT